MKDDIFSLMEMIDQFVEDAEDNSRSLIVLRTKLIEALAELSDRETDDIEDQLEELNS